MLYKELQQVVSLDGQISSLHKELSLLYLKRAVFVDVVNPVKSSSDTLLKAKKSSHQEHSSLWIEHAYAYLHAAWRVHDITIPTFDQLNKKLLRAYSIIQLIHISHPELSNHLNVLLVPPSNILGFPSKIVNRHNQPHITLQDFVNQELGSSIAYKKTWQLLVAHCGLTGEDYGSATHMLKNKNYLINGYDMRDLGPRQYAALSLQLNYPIDSNVWTTLLQDTRTLNSKMAPSVTFLNGQYRFELDELVGDLGENRFRPALEIKG